MLQLPDGQARKRCPADIELDWLQRLSDWHLRHELWHGDLQPVPTRISGHFGCVRSLFAWGSLCWLSVWSVPALLHDIDVLHQLLPRHYKSIHDAVILHLLPGWQVLQWLRRTSDMVLYLSGRQVQLGGLGNVLILPCRQAGDRQRQDSVVKCLFELSCGQVLVGLGLGQLRVLPGRQVPGLLWTNILLVLPGWI